MCRLLIVNKIRKYLLKRKERILIAGLQRLHIKVTPSKPHQVHNVTLVQCKSIFVNKIYELILFCNCRFGMGDRHIMITDEVRDNSILGPGPADYDNLKSKVQTKLARGGPIIRKPTELDQRVKKMLNVVSSEDLFKQKLVSPGPGSYDHTSSRFNSIQHSSRVSSQRQSEQDMSPQRRIASSVSTIPRHSGERCIFEEGETDSPGPARYSMAEAQERLEQASWIKSKNKTSNFSRAKRSVDHTNSLSMR